MAEAHHIISESMTMLLQLQQRAASLMKTVEQLQQRLSRVTAEVHSAFSGFVPLHMIADSIHHPWSGACVHVLAS